MIDGTRGGGEGQRQGSGTGDDATLYDWEIPAVPRGPMFIGQPDYFGQTGRNGEGLKRGGKHFHPRR